MACAALYGEACEFPRCLWTQFFFFGCIWIYSWHNLKTDFFV